MIYLPKLMLTANAAETFAVCQQIRDAAEPVDIDASGLMVAEPMALCALVATVSPLQAHGFTVNIRGLSSTMKQQLERLDILGDSMHVLSGDKEPEFQGSLHVYCIKSEGEGNAAANGIAEALAELIPSARPAASAFEPAMRDHSIANPLAYLFAELIDNGFRHGRGRGYQHANVWISAQFHPPMGLIRLAVADNGCGFLQSFQGRGELAIRSHTDAIRTAFKPFVSSKRDVGLFADSQHQGLGLTICRDLSLRSDGAVAVISGDSWTTNPGVQGETPRSAAFWQGAVISIELRLPALNTVNLLQIAGSYNPDPGLPVRFV